MFQNSINKTLTPVKSRWKTLARLWCESSFRAFTLQASIAWRVFLSRELIVSRLMGMHLKLQSHHPVIASPLDAGRANICCWPGHRVSAQDHRLAAALNAGQRWSPPCNATCRQPSQNFFIYFYNCGDERQTFACRLLTQVCPQLARVCRYHARVHRLPACCCRLVAWYGAELERDGIREASLR